jgi:hypothetical protein
MSQKALGAVFNTSPAADGKWINLKAAGGIAFLCYLAGAAGDTYTLQEAKDSAGTGAKALAVITRYHTNTGDGSDAWTEQTQAAASTVITTATAAQNAMVVEIMGTSLDDGFKFVKLTSTGAGAVNAVITNLMTGRTPANLPAMGV